MFFENGDDYEFVTDVPAGKSHPKITSYGADNEIEVNSDDPLHVVDTKQLNFSSDQKFAWFPKATKFFLRRCLNRKDKFRDSKIEKRVWTEILEEMNSAGFHVENEEILFHKLKNMKRNYRIYNDKHKISKGTGRIIWPYFHILKELFFNATTVNKRRRASFYEEANIDDSSYLSDSSTLPHTTNDKKKFKGMNTLQYLRRKQLRINEKKEEMADKILETLKETNKLQEERNNLILELISIRNEPCPPKSKNQNHLNLGNINFNNVFKLN